MNERIKELEKQSVFYNEETETWELNLEKFAELLIRECFSYAKDGDLDFMKFMIKQNFGVEE